MRLEEILVESSEVNEGPMWDKLKKGATTVGKGIGAVGQGLGAAAGTVAGLGQAMKKGYQGARDTVAAGPSSGVQSTPAPSGSAPATAQSAPMDYKQLLQAVMALPPKAQQKLVAILQKQMPLPTKAKTQAPAGKPSAAMGQMAQQLGGGATQTSTGGLQQQTPTGRVHMANPTNPNQPASVRQAAMPPKARGGKVAGQVSQTPNAMRKRAARAASKVMAPEGYYSKFLGQQI